MRAIGIGLLLSAGVAGAASAAPFEAVDGTSRFLTMMDRSSLARSGAKVDADFLLVSASGAAAITRFRFDCTARTWQQLSQRDIAEDLTLSAPVQMSEAPEAVPAGSLGVSMLERACFNRQANASAGWTTPTLAEAVRQGRAIMARKAKP